MHIARTDERWVGIDDCALWPLFPPELLDVLRTKVPPARWSRIARSVVFSARKPTAAVVQPERLIRQGGSP